MHFLRIWIVGCVSVIQVAAQPFTITEINPSQSTLQAEDPDGGSGGRVNGLGRATNTIFYAASEFGGLYKSSDAGRTWNRLNTHLPTVTWDVKVSPADPQRVIATSFYDGRVNSLAGINVSSDGGATWTHPPTANPSPNFCAVPATARHDERSAFGIAFDPATPQLVYVGTNCGLALSLDGGLTWIYRDPAPGGGADDVWDIVVHHGGIVDICGNDGHRRSINGGLTFTGAAPGGTPLPGGMCSIAASPDEPNVLFATVGRSIFESDDGGGTWNTEFVNRDAGSPGGRIPFVATNKRAGRNFDLWFGDITLYRASCRTPQNPGPGGAARCPVSTSWTGGLTRAAGAHDDVGALAFADPPPINVAQCQDTCSSQQATCTQDCETARKECFAEKKLPPFQCASGFTSCTNLCTTTFNACNGACQPQACPALLSSDGGVYLNTRTTSPACHAPAWTQPDVTPHGLWMFGMAGADRPRNAINEELYLMNQDTGSFGTLTAGAAAPAWLNARCCDGFDAAAGGGRVVTTRCCRSMGRANRVFIHNPGLTTETEIPNYPAGNVPGFTFTDILARFSGNGYVLITTSGIFVTQDITASTITWTQLGAATSPPMACGVQVSGTAASPVFFVQSGLCTGSFSDQVFRFNGTGSGAWQKIDPPAVTGSTAIGFGIFAVDRGNANRLFASITTTGDPRMARSANGGASWTFDPPLDTLMTGAGTFRYQTRLGPINFTDFGPYAQPTLLAFDPNDANTLLAGASDSGIFLSRNGGANWLTMTNNAGTAENPHIPRPRFAYFDRECRVANIYVGTQGRGAWRLSYSVGGAIDQKQCLQNCTNLDTDCRAGCDDIHKSCLAEVGKPGGSTIAQCNTQFTQCKNQCTMKLNACNAACSCPD